MFFASAPPAHAIQTPTQIVHIITESNYGIERGEVFPSSMKELIISMTEFAKRLVPELQKMNKYDAKDLLSIISPLLPDFFEAKESIEKDLKQQLQASEILLLHQLFAAVIPIISEIIFISNDREIDENSESYNTFLAELITKEMSASQRHIGRKKLMNLFD